MPENATFWLAKGRGPGSASPPLPAIPAELIAFDLPIYSLGGDSFLIDDSSVDYSALDEERQIDRALGPWKPNTGLDLPAWGMMGAMTARLESR